ncbi:TPA: Rha family transcriptional regulator [Citrobacter freundii]|nr:Rha family transcriptional regulator [Citrobacter freundii]
MKMLPAVDTLQPILHGGVPVITTVLLAQLYGTTTHSITKNHRNNTVRFEDGKHYYKVVGQDLITLRVTLGDSQISPKTRALILWTERGAARHAKMLETDQAWEVFERLEDSYFNQRPQPAANAIPKNIREVMDSLNATPEFYIRVQNGKPITTSVDVADAFNITHDTVVKTIDALHLPRAAAAQHFLKENRRVEDTKHTDVEMTFYRMTKDGFMFFMGAINGPGTTEIKLAYIEAFNTIDNMLQIQHERQLVKKLSDQSSIAARSSKEHQHLLTQPDYRHEVLREFDRVTGKGTQPFNLDGLTREKVVSGLLLDLLRNSRAIVSFSDNLTPKIEILPTNGIVVNPSDRESVLTLANAGLSTEILQALIVASVDKLAAR